MIGFNHLGNLGQLGNQMFQYAALKGIAGRHGYQYCIPKNSVVTDALGNKLRTELFDVFNLNVNIQKIETDQYLQEPSFNYSENFFNSCPDNVSLWGFFQSEKYFKHIEKEIRKDFTFKMEIVEDCKNIIKDIFDDPIALHIRRGDFLINSGNHYNQSLEYYENALSKFDSDRQVVIFSDDPQWCIEQKLFESDRFIVSSGNNPYMDLYLMSQCDDFIIANSTFSWWGAWLADKGRVIAPKKWFGPNNSHLNTKDLYPEHWEII
jgi:hypothetical protein